MMPWEKPPVRDDLEVPACLKRDANNVAPYMRSSREDNLQAKDPIALQLWGPTTSFHS
jgi:hypothetical protein